MRFPSYTPPRYSGWGRRHERNAMYGYTMNKKAVSDRLRRIEGQVRGIQRIVDEDQYCIDILTQVNSAASALKSVGMGVLDDHVRHCVRESVESGYGEEKLEELLTAVARFAGK
jgi:DNA-binding FrmR family transcriptional regulator